MVAVVICWPESDRNVPGASLPSDWLFGLVGRALGLEAALADWLGSQS